MTPSQQPQESSKAGGSWGEVPLEKGPEAKSMHTALADNGFPEVPVAF